MPEELDFVERRGLDLGLSLRPRTVFVEGTSDEDLFGLAARFEKAKTGIDLTGRELAIVAAGVAENGGVDGVVRVLNGFRFMAPVCLSTNGLPKYRFIGLFDHDRAGREAIKLAREFDKSALEYRDVFLLRPVMPLHTDRDPASLQKKFEVENLPYKGLDWELEDLLPESFWNAFTSSFPAAIAKVTTVSGRAHRDMTRDGKARFHRFVKQNATHADLQGVIATIRALRFYLGMRAL